MLLPDDLALARRSFPPQLGFMPRVPATAGRIAATSAGIRDSRPGRARTRGIKKAPRQSRAWARQSFFDELSSPSLRPLTIIGATDLSANRRARHRDYVPRLGYFHPPARPWLWYFPDWRRLFAEPAGDCSWSPAGSAELSSLPGGQSFQSPRAPRCGAITPRRPRFGRALTTCGGADRTIRMSAC